MAMQGCARAAQARSDSVGAEPIGPDCTASEAEAHSDRDEGNDPEFPQIVIDISDALVEGRAVVGVERLLASGAQPQCGEPPAELCHDTDIAAETPRIAKGNHWGDVMTLPQIDIECARVVDVVKARTSTVPVTR